MRAWGVLAAAVLVTACGGASEPRITVGVASSLVDVLEGLDYPGVEYSVAGSQVLVAQVREGAPLDLVITADLRTADMLESLGVLAGSPVRFAGNRLTIAVPPGNPAGIRALGDLADPALTVVLAAPEVPAGAYAAEMLAAAGIEVVADSLEPSVRGALAKVALGEADGAIVYATDLASADVDGVAIPASQNVDTSYYAAVIAGDRAPVATEFVQFLRGARARQVLARYGFLP